MLGSPLPVCDSALVGHARKELIERSPFGYLSLNILPGNLWKRLEPSLGQQVNQRRFATAGTTRYHVPVRLDPERSCQKFWVQLCGSKTVLCTVNHFAILQSR